MFLLFAVGDAAGWSIEVISGGGRFVELLLLAASLPVLSFPRMDLWLGRERVTQRRVMLLQGAVHQHVHVVETHSVKPSENRIYPQQ